jgi:hypothetical protein
MTTPVEGILPFGLRVDQGYRRSRSIVVVTRRAGVASVIVAGPGGRRARRPVVPAVVGGPGGFGGVAVIVG